MSPAAKTIFPPLEATYWVLVPSITAFGPAPGFAAFTKTMNVAVPTVLAAEPATMIPLMIPAKGILALDSAAAEFTVVLCAGYVMVRLFCPCARFMTCHMPTTDLERTGPNIVTLDGSRRKLSISPLAFHLATEDVSI